MAYIPPKGTSAYKAYSRQFREQNPSRRVSSGSHTGIAGSFKQPQPFDSLSGKLFGALPKSSAKETLTNAANRVSDALSKPPRDDIGIVSGLYDDHGGSSGSGSSSAKKVIPYKNADWAAHYGMDAGTAYAESMQNTTYQRTIKDMQAAGLNPAVMFANGANTNTSFYMGAPAPETGASGGSSGSSSGRSAAGRSGKLFSPKMYSTISEVAGVAAAAITRRPWNYSSGKAIAQGAMRIANNLFGR